MKYERKKQENLSKIKKKLDEDAMVCNTLWSDRRRVNNKKHILPFRVLLNVGIDPNFPPPQFFFLPFGLYSEKNYAFLGKHF